MTAETTKDTLKEQALAKFETVLRAYPYGEVRGEDAEAEIAAAYDLIEQTGVSFLDMTRVELKVLTPGHRQAYFNMIAKDDLRDRLTSLDDGFSRFEAFISLRKEFDLIDPYSNEN